LEHDASTPCLFFKASLVERRIDILDIISSAKERLLDAQGYESSLIEKSGIYSKAVAYFRIYEEAQKPPTPSIFRT